MRSKYVTEYFPRAQVPTATIQLSLFGNVGCSGAFLVQTGVTPLLECTFNIDALNLLILPKFGKPFANNAAKCYIIEETITIQPFLFPVI